MNPIPISEPEIHDHDRGLAFDLSTMQRRTALKLFAGAGLVALVGCGADDPTTSGVAAASEGAPAATTDSSGGAIPEETAGPYPGDGTNGPNVLTESGVVRSDIRSSFGSSTTMAEGIPLTVQLTVLDTANANQPLEGAALYLWHCDREGRYSLYSEGVTGENYLRGVQVADADGSLSFTTIFPAAYSGRWPHMHFEVYSSLDQATSAGTPIATSQLALPEDTCAAVFATDGYEQSVSNLAGTSLETDMVFSDGTDQQLPSISGTVDEGYVAALSVPV